MSENGREGDGRWGGKGRRCAAPVRPLLPTVAAGNVRFGNIRFDSRAAQIGVRGISWQYTGYYWCAHCAGGSSAAGEAAEGGEEEKRMAVGGEVEEHPLFFVASPDQGTAQETRRRRRLEA